MNFNFEIGAYLAPVIIIFLNFSFRKKTLMSKLDYIVILIESSIHIFGMSFFLFFLHSEKIFDTGWAPITLLYFNIPIFITLVISYYYFKYVVKKKLTKY